MEAASVSARGGAPRRDATAADAVTLWLATLGLPVHRASPGEWGVALPCCGGPVRVGLALRGGLLRVRGEVLPPGRVDPWWLLHRNRRSLVLVRYATSAAGAVWVQGELPADGLSPGGLDALMARVLEAADAAREAATRGPLTTGGPPRSSPRR